MLTQPSVIKIHGWYNINGIRWGRGLRLLGGFDV